MSTATPAAAKPGRGVLLLGLACAVLGVAAYVAQVSMSRLTTPWYLPATGIVGVVLVVLALGQKRTIWRWLTLAFVGFLAAFEGLFLFGTRLPAYAGPLEIGKPFPAFQTLRADGSTFTQADFKGDKNTVLVFFRGRW
jgi:hypothetical protein